MKRTLLSLLCLSCVTFTSQAIDINIPGADPTISKDAYQNYRKSDATAKQMESDVNTMIRKQYADNKPKNWSIDELVFRFTPLSKQEIDVEFKVLKELPDIKETVDCPYCNQSLHTQVVDSE